MKNSPQNYDTFEKLKKFPLLPWLWKRPVLFSHSQMWIIDQLYIKLGITLQYNDDGNFKLHHPCAIALQSVLSRLHFSYTVIFPNMHLSKWLRSVVHNHGLRTPGEEIAFTARPKIKSQSQIFRYGLSISPNFQISLIYAFTGYLQSVAALVGF